MPNSKNQKKSTKNKKKTIENQIENMEKATNVIEKISKEEKAKKNKAAKRKKEQEEKISKMREDLQNQLISQNKFGEQFNDMVEHYLFLVKLKDDLKYDIMDNGLRYEVTTGNGYTATKPNESVQNLTKVSSEMRKILQDLDLKEPEVDLQESNEPEEGVGDDLL